MLAAFLVVAGLMTGAQASMVTAINHARAHHDLKPVAAAEPLHRIALHHSGDMVVRHYFGHISPSGVGVKRRIVGSGFVTGYYWTGGEVLARGYTDPASAVSAWLASPEHRAILLAKWPRWIGVGRSFNSRGRAFWTADFVRRWRP